MKRIIGFWLSSVVGLPSESSSKTYPESGDTRDMIHSINYVIAYLSTFIKLQRGDLIIFGTPAGVGAGIKPYPIFLKNGDIIELEIEGLGKQKHKVIDQN